jgi:hypothetical protein
MLNDKQIEKILKRDALDETEKMTGSSYKDSPFTQQMAILNHLEAVAHREAAMLLTGDTAFSNKLDYYMKAASSIGFKKVLELPFAVKSDWDERPRIETYFIFWRDGILLSFDTYNSDHVNGGHFYYNWKGPRGSYLSSGHAVENDIWVGDHDCREGLKFHIRQLEENGSFLPKWVERPFLWMLHHGDTANDKVYDYESLNAKRIAMLPREVREAITPAC